MMNPRTTVFAACAVIAGWLALSGCATRPAPQKGAAGQAMMDISQVPGPQSARYVSEAVPAERARQPRPSPEALARAAMEDQAEGMRPGVAGALKEQIVIRTPGTSSAPEARKPVLTIPALQPGAPALPPDEESWKKPLPPLRSLEGK